MEDIFYIEDEVPADAIYRARQIMRFVQAGTDAFFANTMNDDAVMGMRHTIDAADSLLLKAETRCRRTVSHYEGMRRHERS